jgi:hypothetical protein
MRQIGFLCGNSVFLNIDDEVVSLKFSNNKIDVDVENKYNQSTGQCSEIQADIELLYTAKYYPRTYYSVYRVVLQLQSKTKKVYLLEQYNGSTGLVMYYVCRSFKLCLKKIDKLEED